ncbi:MAG: hypothetical protein HPY71_09630 [Firmicutes bacterium]|nr:hypothetical protein [Bacillota bacterium]
MATAEIHSGICGFVTRVKAETSDMQNVALAIESDCPNIQKLAGELKSLDAFKEVLSRAVNTITYQLASKFCPHPGCPVPSGILKAVEVAVGMALPKDAQILVKKD